MTGVLQVVYFLRRVSKCVSTVASVVCKRDGRFVFIAHGNVMCFIFRFKLAINKSPLINKKTTCYYNIEKVQITVVYIVTVFHSI